MAKKPQTSKHGQPGHNSGDTQLDDEKEQQLFRTNLQKYQRLLQAKRKADKDLQDHGKIIKKDHGPNGLTMIKTTIALDDPETEADEKKKAEDIVKAMRWAGVPIGFQGALFGDYDERTLEERAFADGKKTGMDGQPMSAPTTYAAGDAFQEWCKGWHAGQEAIFGIKKGPKAEGEDGEASEDGEGDGDADGESGDDEVDEDRTLN